ncbi:MAG: hypothetical protein N2035_06145 [Chthoniobacterales bacterium]|nr:hypothetical protein [Chthoniobacterales bacterium]
MSLFSKFLLFLILLAAGYILWPRQPSLHSFTPEKIATLETQAWKAILANDKNQAILAYYQIFDFQFHLPPITAFNAAKLLSETLLAIFNSKDEKKQDLLAHNFVEFYSILKRETKAPFDAAFVGNDEHTVWLLLSSKDPSKHLISEVQRVLAGLFSVIPDRCAAAAEARSKAMQITFLSQKQPDWNEVQKHLATSWQQLATLKPSH